MYRYAFFDLDGTLTDSSEGIINSIKYALEKNGYPVPDETELLKFIGPPLADSFAGYLNLPKDQVQDMVDTYREYFAVKGLFENRVYDGAESMLAKLKRAGVELVLATSKPELRVRFSSILSWTSILNTSSGQRLTEIWGANQTLSKKHSKI